MRAKHWTRNLAAILLALCLALCMCSCYQGRRSAAQAQAGSGAAPARRRPAPEQPTGGLDSGEVIESRRAAAAQDAAKRQAGRRQGSSDDLQPTPTPTPAATAAPQSTPTPKPAATAAPQPEQPAVYRQVVAGLREAAYPLHLECSYEEFLEAYTLVQQDPAFFWVRGYEASYTSTEVDVYFLYTHDTPQAIAEAQQRIDAVAAEFLAGVPADASAQDKALYLHDWLIEHIEYVSDGGWNDQTLYGALAEGESVCAGFSQAFTYLGRRMGLEAYTIIGYASEEPVTTTGNEPNHSWNAVTIDGSTRYFDPTWDNTDRTDAAGREYVPHMWCGVPLEEMEQTHAAQNSADLRPTTDGGGDYFAAHGYAPETFQVEQAAALYRQQAQQGKNVLELRFPSAAVFEQARAQVAQLSAQVEASSYGIHESRRVLYFWV